MCKGIIGKKLGMTSVYSHEGQLIPVTVIQVGPCVVTQIKTESVDGYNALQLGMGEKKESKITQPMKGHIRKTEKNVCAVLKEFPVDKPEEFSVGQVIDSDMFDVGEVINVTGITKGRGFAGVIKRHGFGGGRETHGGKCHRIPGSIGCSAWPSKVTKGKKMPGHYGNDKKTIKKLKIVDIRPDENVILLKGAVPGSRSGVVTINKTKY
ncbi:50S ribosomal protein L3 [Desulfonema limicola]|uniref:Large ribosomal subunit protein uL3 n=1 Tax=Desulfonema limicola TaxID=45656 RepID=A0A975B4W8_9BACT|nr:50S ribosomal protein L3 [Desulfonema limicola]QTA78842.1 50S ribosomal protein L3 [Desulfonema limicola]